MSAKRITLDTNLLVYAVDAADRDRHRRAQTLINALLRYDCVLTLQALSEFYFATTRRGKLSADAAQHALEGWQKMFPVVAAKPSTLNSAINAVAAHQLAFWDAMLWATAKDAGVTLLLSEDFQDGQIVEGVRIANPLLSKDVPALLST